MRKPIILDIFNPKNVFDRKIINNEHNYFLTASIPGKRKYIKKFAKNLLDEIVFIKTSTEMHPLLRNKTYIYDRISIEAITAIIEKLCRSVANKESIGLPFNEIIIVAPEEFAYALIFPLVNICRMFTVVSNTHNIKRNDEMYFKYGCIIRNKVKLEDFSAKQNLVICADNNINCECINMQVINLTSTEYERKNIVNIRHVKVFDGRISNFVNQWNGVPGLELYELFGITPDCETDIDINIKSDKIFLLDINKV